MCRFSSVQGATETPRPMNHKHFQSAVINPQGLFPPPLSAQLDGRELQVAGVIFFFLFSLNKILDKGTVGKKIEGDGGMHVHKALSGSNSTGSAMLRLRDLNINGAVSAADALPVSCLAGTSCFQEPVLSSPTGLSSSSRFRCLLCCTYNFFSPYFSLQEF